MPTHPHTHARSMHLADNAGWEIHLKEREIVVLTARKKIFVILLGRSRQSLWAGVEEELSALSGHPHPHFTALCTNRE